MVSLVVNFRRSVIIAELWRPEVARPENFVVAIFVLFRRFTWRRVQMSKCPNLCPNFVKFVRREISDIVRCLPDKKFRLPLKLSLLSGSRPKSASASPNNVLTLLQISSKSVHLRWSYSRRWTPFLPRKVFLLFAQSIASRWIITNFDNRQHAGVWIYHGRTM